MNNTANNNLEELTDSDFLDMMQSIKGTKVILGDFCYSGALVPSNFVSVGTNEFNDMDINVLFGNRDRIDVDPSLYVLSAARYSEKSYTKRDGTHGFFTAALLEALGWDEDLQCLKASPVVKNGMITLHNIARYVIKNDDNSSQNPMFSGGSNDLVLFSFR